MVIAPIQKGAQAQSRFAIRPYPKDATTHPGKAFVSRCDPSGRKMRATQAGVLRVRLDLEAELAARFIKPALRP